ncbi:MAG: hypothetical protein ABH952_08570 [Candidatus Omnitrophota bacterium]
METQYGCAPLLYSTITQINTNGTYLLFRDETYQTIEACFKVYLAVTQNFQMRDLLTNYL